MPDPSQPVSSLAAETVEDSLPEQATPVKTSSFFKQVRQQIKSQAATTVPKNGILELVHMAQSRELEMNRDPNVDQSQDKDDNAEEILAVEASLDEEKGECCPCSDTMPDPSQPVSSLAAETVEDSVPEQATPVKTSSFFQQVRQQIKSQAATTVPKNGILELMQMVKSRELEMNRDPNVNQSQDKDDKAEEISAALECAAEVDPKREDLVALFQREVEAGRDAMRIEFRKQMEQLRMEMRCYTDLALAVSESRMQSKPMHSRHVLPRLHQAGPSENRSLEKKLKPPGASSLVPAKPWRLSRTMTTITHKTCPPIVLAPRSKSETLSPSKKENDTVLLLKDADFHVFASQNDRQRGPLPPACPPVNHRKKLLRTKVQA